MKKLCVFSIVAAMVMVMVLGCNFIPADKTVDTSAHETCTSSAVFLNPDLVD